MLIELILFVLLIVTAWAVASLSDLFSAAMLLGMFSLLSAGLFVIMDAVDVAFTEAAVGAGISTVLILATLALTSTQEDQQPFRVLPFIAVLVTGGALLVGTADMPQYGDANAPIHGHVAPGYIEGTDEVFQIPNIVTAVLGSYRGYDTLGETGVIFTAGVGVMLLLGGRRKRRPEPAAAANEASESEEEAA